MPKRAYVRPFTEVSEVSFKRTRDKKNTLELARSKMVEGLFSEALTLLHKVVDEEPEASFLMGTIYFDGLGIDPDKRRGIECMQKLAMMKGLTPDEQRFQSEALCNLAFEYYLGEYLPKDDDEAERYWHQAAEMDAVSETGTANPGVVKAQNALGMFYSKPDHHNIEKSHFWHNKASRNGSVQSEGALGVMFLYGLGTQEDPTCAYGHLLNASLQKNIYAQGYLAAYYYMRQMYHRAADMGKLLSERENLEELAEKGETSVENVKQGVALGCFILALCYQYGYGGIETKDLEKAKALITRAMELSPCRSYELHLQSIMGEY